MPASKAASSPTRKPSGRQPKVSAAAAVRTIEPTPIKRPVGRPRKTPVAVEAAADRYEVAEMTTQPASGRLGVMRIKADGSREVVARYHTRETADWVRQVMARGAA